MIALTKKTLTTLAVVTLIQGCADGSSFNMGGIVKKAPTEAEYAAEVKSMNCTELRAELVKQERRTGLVLGVVYGEKAETRVTNLKSRMRRLGCRIPS
ncbi:MAG: hypothetical protein KAT26_05585 [Marinosulfonomonas sp.]|nr:hypothetical protein [Marinosulfonomonas sp.]